VVKVMLPLVKELAKAGKPELIRWPTIEKARH
jgi:hypothetical protein